ncbi:MAG: TlpA family protein disulfide reductase [Candidatus Zixiibacteriota bacterium]|nr:MAG: TlpA family protein disulfide reductase [candidate division Zixibacteria bacterium]
MLGKFITLTILTSALALLTISCGGDNQAEQTSETETANPAKDPTGNPGSPAGEAQTPAVQSEFLFTTYDIDGNLRNSAEWVGQQPVVLNFWGTWCPPCRKEIPDLVKLYAEFRPRGIEILGLAVRDNPDNVIKYSREHGMNWVMLMADNSLAMRYRLTGVPTTIFIDRSGKEVGRFVGPRDYETFKEAFLITLNREPDSSR